MINILQNLLGNQNDTYFSDHSSGYLEIFKQDKHKNIYRLMCMSNGQDYFEQVVYLPKTAKLLNSIIKTEKKNVDFAYKKTYLHKKFYNFLKNNNLLNDCRLVTDIECDGRLTFTLISDKVLENRFQKVSEIYDKIREDSDLKKESFFQEDFFSIHFVDSDMWINRLILNSRN